MRDGLIIAACAIYSLIIAAHILVNVLPKKSRLALGIANVCLHVALLPFVVALGLDFELIALIFVSSLFIYLLSSYLFFIKRKGGRS